MEWIHQSQNNLPHPPTSPNLKEKTKKEKKTDKKEKKKKVMIGGGRALFKKLGLSGIWTRDLSHPKRESYP